MSSGNDLIEKLSIDYYESARDIAMTLSVPRDDFTTWVEAHVLMRLSLISAVRQVHEMVPGPTPASVAPSVVFVAPPVRRARRRTETPRVDYLTQGPESGDGPELGDGPEEDGAPMPKEWA